MELIAAIATAQSPPAIGIARLSWEATRDALAALFTPANGMVVSDLPYRRMTYGDVRDETGALRDRCMAVCFSAAHSYTGEESAEIHCHGSPVVLGEVLRAAFRAGARQARPGEFTQRAFLNGKMDLTEAEAVIDLIDAETAECARNAVAQLSGALRRPIEAVYDRLLDISSRFYAIVDYPDEEIEDLSREETAASLTASEEILSDLLGTFARGRVLKSGVATAIVGAPNAGKSSRLNALVGFDRAIVTDIAGTTRDTVEEKVRVGHVLLRLCDTAGIHQTEDAVEKIGVARARAAARQASLALLALDGSSPLTEADREAMALARQAPNLLVAVNKSDLPRAVDIGRLADEFDNVVSLTARSGEGVSVRCDAIGAMYPAGEGRPGELLTNARQADAVSRALASVRSARSALRIGMTPDVVLTDAEAALEALGELNGKHIRDDLIQTIFSRFCVGK